MTARGVQPTHSGVTVSIRLDFKNCKVTMTTAHPSQARLFDTRVQVLHEFAVLPHKEKTWQTQPDPTRSGRPA
jgi:hypothetical protein